MKINTLDCVVTVGSGIAWEVDSFPLTEEKARLDARYTQAIKRVCMESD